MQRRMQDADTFGRHIPWPCRALAFVGLLFALGGCGAQFSGPPPPSQAEQLCMSGATPQMIPCASTHSGVPEGNETPTHGRTTLPVHDLRNERVHPLN